MKKVSFINKPEANDRGQFNFYDEQQPPFNYTSSNGLPPGYDKFADSSLYTISKTHNINDAIITSMILFVYLNLQNIIDNYNSGSNLFLKC